MQSPIPNPQSAIESVPVTTPEEAARIVGLHDTIYIGWAELVDSKSGGVYGWVIHLFRGTFVVKTLPEAQAELISAGATQMLYLRKSRDQDEPDQDGSVKGNGEQADAGADRATEFRSIRVVALDRAAFLLGVDDVGRVVATAGLIVPAPWDGDTWRILRFDDHGKTHLGGSSVNVCAAHHRLIRLGAERVYSLAGRTQDQPEPDRAGSAKGNREQAESAVYTTAVPYVEADSAEALIALDGDRYLGDANLCKDEWLATALAADGDVVESHLGCTRGDAELWFRNRGATRFVHFRLPEPRTPNPEPSPATDLIGTDGDRLIGHAYRYRSADKSVYDDHWAFRDTAQHEFDVCTAELANRRLLALGATQVLELNRSWQ